MSVGLEQFVHSLALRQRSILLALQLLSESPGASFVATQRIRPKKDSSPPRGVRGTVEIGQLRDTGHAPDRHESLFEHYRYRFDKATTVRQRMLLCCLAERDWWEVVNRVVQDARREDSATRSARILEVGEGVHSLELAVFEGCSQKHIEQLRKADKRDPRFGLPTEIQAPELAAA